MKRKYNEKENVANSSDTDIGDLVSEYDSDYEVLPGLVKSEDIIEDIEDVMYTSTDSSVLNHSPFDSLSVNVKRAAGRSVPEASRPMHGVVYDIEDIIRSPTLTKDFFFKPFFIQKLTQKFMAIFRSKKYVKLIREMCSNNLESVYVDYADLEDSNLSHLFDVYAEGTSAILTKALEEVTKSMFTNYFMIKPSVHARITNLPVLENIRGLRNNHLSKLVKINGVVTRRSGVFPLYSLVKYTCLRCKATFGPSISTVHVDAAMTEDQLDQPNVNLANQFYANSSSDQLSNASPGHCFECQSKGPFTINSAETIYKDFQKLTLQEIPGTVPPGSLPRNKEILLFYDLIDVAKPGEEVEVVGVYKNNFSLSLNIKNGFPVFFTVIEASSVNKKVGKREMTDDDIKEIIKLSKNANIKSMIINSIAPSIYGHKDIKRAIALALFSGVPKEANNHKIRGDINVLLLGDPGTAKSQFLRYIESLSHRAVLATGQGASSVGLTASVRKDPVLREWTLEGGALVLADKGVCLIDEFDKMNEHDRTSIHEAMEQQSISISKAGIVATLHARCSVIAAANPVRGRYNPSLTFAQNVNLSDPIISRFDVLCVVKDIIDMKEDERTADFVLNIHIDGNDGKKKLKDERIQRAGNYMQEDLKVTKTGVQHGSSRYSDVYNTRKGSEQDEKQECAQFSKLTDYTNGSQGSTPSQRTLSQDTLRKYILYARENVIPTFSEQDMHKVSQLYSDLRKESMSSGLPITVRHIESIIRMSEAFAKMRLSTNISNDDIDEAISVALDSFMGAQKYSVTKNLRKKFMKYLVKDNVDVLVFILKDMFNDRMIGFNNRNVNASEFEKRVMSHGFKVNSEFYECKEFNDSGFKLDRCSKKITWLNV